MCKWLFRTSSSRSNVETLAPLVVNHAFYIPAHPSIWRGLKSFISCTSVWIMFHILQSSGLQVRAVRRPQSTVMNAGFHHLRQLRRIRRSANRDSAVTLVHEFVTSRVDYCNAVFAAAPKVTTNKLQRVLNAAARVVTGTRKFDRGLSQLLHTELHWPDVPERVKYKLCVMVHRCLSGCAPQYLATESWWSVS